MSHTELKNVILYLFDQIRDANTRVAKMARALEEKDRRNAILTEKLDAVLDNQKKQRLDLESWLAKERRWNKEREGLLKTIRDLKDIVKISKKAKLVGTFWKSYRKAL